MTHGGRLCQEIITANAHVDAIQKYVFSGFSITRYTSYTCRIEGNDVIKWLSNYSYLDLKEQNKD